MKTDTTPREIIFNTLNHLREIDYRNTFYTTVLDKVIEALNEHDPNVARKFHSLMVTGRYYTLIQEILGGDESILDLYEEVFRAANGPGSFQMPEWGTYGT